MIKLHINENVKWDEDLPLYIGDLFVDDMGNAIKVIKINDDDITIRNLKTNIISHMRRDYLCNNFEIVEGLNSKSTVVKESYHNDWEEIGTETLYINDDRLRLPRYEKRIDKIVIHVVPENDNDELVWTVYYTPEIGMAGFKFVESGFFTSGEAIEFVDNEFIPKLSIDEEYIM